jgi:hypothetical protein
LHYRDSGKFQGHPEAFRFPDIASSRQSRALASLCASEEEDRDAALALTRRPEWRSSCRPANKRTSNSEGAPMAAFLRWQAKRASRDGQSLDVGGATRRTSWLAIAHGVGWSRRKELPPSAMMSPFSRTPDS